MRHLFISERRYIKNMMLRNHGIDFDNFEPVRVERYSPPRIVGGRRFNNDYVLQFVEDLKSRGPFSSCSAHTLPNTIGADVFLTIDTGTSRPLRTELLGGEAFGIRYFTEYIESLQSLLAGLPQIIMLRKCTYCRIFVIEGDVCFLAFPDEPLPVMRGDVRTLRSDAGACIQYSTCHDKIVFVDGWIRTQTVESEWKLEAVLE